MDLAATGVEAVVLGPLALRLATGVLSDPGPVPRVELLVPADRGGPAVRALAAHGWGPAADLALDDALATRAGLALVRPALDDAELTVLWRADPDDLRPEADDGLWARARDLAWGQVEGTVAVPSAADLLALEVLARGRHEPEGWVAVSDLIELVAQVDDEEQLAAILRERRAQGTAILHVVADADGHLPPAVEGLVREERRGPRAFDWYRGHRVRPTWGPVDAPVRFVARHVGIVAPGRHRRLALGDVAAHLRTARAGPSSLARPSGEAMNGQVVRREIVRRIAVALPVDRVIETGTFKGHTTSFLARELGGPTWTVEADPKRAAAVQQRLGRRPGLHLCAGDSADVVADLVPQFERGRTFFYLDAHWEARLPLWAELAAVFANAEDPIVLIDDFAVPGDPGYGYDDYGPGQVLDADHLAPRVPDGFGCWYPAVPAAAETGARRGCVVVARDEHAAALEGCLLRR